MAKDLNQTKNDLMPTGTFIAKNFSWQVWVAIVLVLLAIGKGYLNVSIALVDLKGEFKVTRAAIHGLQSAMSDRFTGAQARTEFKHFNDELDAIRMDFRDLRSKEDRRHGEN